MLRAARKFAIALAVAGLSALTPAMAAFDFRSGDTLQVEGDLTEMSFLSGGEVTVTAQSADDIFVAGGEVALTGASGDHLFLAGGEVSLSEVTAKDVFGASGDISMNGSMIADDVVLAGGSIELSTGNQIGGSAAIAGGSITIDAAIGGDLMVHGGQVFLNGQIGGDADLEGERIKIGPDARITGKLTHKTSWIDIDPAAVIEGGTVALEPQDYEDFKDGAIAAAIAASVVGVMILIGLVVGVLFLAGFFGGFMRASDEMIRGRTLSTVAVGFLTFVLLPVLVILLMVTVFGIPLAVLLIAFFIAAYPLGFAAAAHALGMFVRGLFRRDAEGEAPGALGRVGWALIGVLALIALGMVPFAGAVIWFLAVVVGMGATVSVLYRFLAQGRSATGEA